MAELFGVLGAQQVGTAGRAVQHRPAGEHAAHRVGGVVQHVADVVVSMPRGVHDPQPDRPDIDHVAIADSAALVADLITGRNQVFGIDGTGEVQTAGDVVVVDVRLEHMGDPHRTLTG